MQIKPTLGSVVGQINPQKWGQVLLSPGAYGVVEVEDEAGAARGLGIRVLSQLAQGLESQPNNLKAVEAIVDEVLQPGVTTLLVLVPVGQVVYLVLRGNGAVYLKRDEQIAPLMLAQGAISGEIKLHDTLLLVSRGFTRLLPQQKLVATFDHLSATEAAEKLTLMLHEQEGGEGSAALIFQATEFIPLEAEESAPNRPVPQPRPMETLLQATSRRFSGSARRRLTALRGKLPQAFGANKRKLMLVSVVLLVLLLGSIGLGLRRQAGRAQNQEVTRAMAEAQHALDEGVALLELNPVKGRQRLTQAKTLLEPLVASFSSRSSQGKELAKLYQQVIDNLAQAMQVVRANPSLFYDVSLLKKGAQATTLSLAGDTLGVVDRDTRTVYAISLPTKSGQVVAGGDAYPNPSFIAAATDKFYVLTETGVNAVSLADKKTSASVIKKDSEWGTLGAMVAYGGNLYLLDVQKSRIWKYVATESGFSPLREYLNPDTLPNLSKATGMAIDGSVWLGTGDGKILRFTQGKENTFVPQGVDPPLGTNLLVYTSDSVKNVYVVDSEKNRLVVLDKDGVYLAQYIWEAFTEGEQQQTNLLITGLAVSETQKKIFLLANGRIYGLELK